MQVSVEKTSEISRKMTVSVPEAVVQEKVSARLKSLARSVKVDGFRPGKVPDHVVKKMYGERVRNEITGDLIESTYVEAIKEHSLQPAGYPNIHSADHDADGFKYIAEFEVYPEVSLAGIAEVSFVRPVAELGDGDLENMLTRLRTQRITWNEVPRAAANSDRVTINFSGVSEGENFTNGKVENIQVELGAGKMIAGFEDNLIGLAAGDQKAFEVTFPENYGNDKLSGKPAQFDVEVVKVEEGVLPEIDAEFVKIYGIESGDVEAFKVDVRENMQRELHRALQDKLKNRVMDALYESIPVTLPVSLINGEVQNLLKPYVENAKKQNIKLDDLKLPRDVFETQAKRRVALGLILAEIIRGNNMNIDADRVRKTITDMAQSYEQPEDVINWYYAERDRLVEIEQLVLEEQAVEWVLANGKVSEEAISFDVAMNRDAQAPVES